jgi:hypothetical protein
MAGIDIGLSTYRIVVGSEGRARLEIHSPLGGPLQVYPRHSILSLTYREDTSIVITLINGSTISVTLPTKVNSEDVDTRFVPKLRKLFVELSDLLL